MFSVVAACNAMVIDPVGTLTLHNYGKALNCSIAILLPTTISLVNVDVGEASETMPAHNVETGLIHQVGILNLSHAAHTSCCGSLFLKYDEQQHSDPIGLALDIFFILLRRFVSHISQCVVKDQDLIFLFHIVINEKCFCYTYFFTQCSNTLHRATDYLQLLDGDSLDPVYMWQQLDVCGLTSTPGLLSFILCPISLL